MTRILTGIKPTGTPHIGNLLGAIRPALALAALPDTEAMYFIADYHALTTVHDGKALAELTREVAATWLAFGLDPERTLFYRQSDVPETFELAWILACFTSKGWMNKMHAYKARVQDQGTDAETADAGINVGLYTYPILMAADILLFDTDLVPVGKDQVQHVEIARDMAQRVNHTFKAELLRLPQAKVEEQTAVVVGLDGRKMSKSYDNVIPLLAPAKQLRKTVNRIVTDSTPPEAPKDPDTSHIFQLYKLFATPEQVAALDGRYRAGIGWGDAKGALADVLEATLAGPRATYEALMADPASVEALLVRGAERARAYARPVLQRLREAIGIRR
ncbi:MAG: tryptophan--tRNA ligase [Myxococcota bacterium]|nr:tryptophan--tRNA ligase [Myxococcota bacterium]